jgi:regulatory protein
MSSNAMKITKITQQVKQTGRYSIFLDGVYSFSLSETALLESKLVSGQELTKELVDTYKQLSNEDKLYQRTLNYVALRPHTTWEIEQYLRRKGSPAPLIEQITNKLTQLGLLDDAKFAAAFVHDRQLFHPTSRRKMMLELRKKHVNDDIVREVLANEAGDDQTALLAIIESKRKQTKYQDDLKLMQYLARQGFSYDIIKSALRTVSSDSLSEQL